MASTDYKFEGWLGLDKTSAEGKMVWQQFEPKPFEETDVDIQITHSGICGSDLHTLRSGWGPTLYPVCVGHEIVGKAVRVGSKAGRGIKVGDRVGVGAQASSCQRKADCDECANGHENHCAGNVGTYNSKFPDGSKSYGGYATYHRAPAPFVFKIPDNIESKDAAPMMCGGITVFSPLKENGCGPGKRVGIVGVGGLGHFGVIFAKALGADRVVGISRKADKRNDVLKMGADAYIATDEDKDWAKTHSKSLDLIVCTVSSPSLPLNKYLQLLRTKGTFIQVGAPEDVLPAINAFSLIGKGVKVGGSMIGPPHEIEDMLKVVSEKDLKPWINTWPMAKANDAIIAFEAGKARYRITLEN